MIKEGKLEELASSYKFFKKSTSALTEEDSNFAPKEGMMTVAQQVAHVAQTFDWFMEGAFDPNGFSMDFEGAAAEVKKYDSLQRAQAYLDEAYEKCRSIVASKTDEELSAKLKDERIMGPAPVFAVINATIEHTAHHRGSLAVYTRMLDKVPPMPYM